MPILTITMPVFNAMPYLPDAVESVLRQSYRDFHFLIIDDGSSDGSSEYLSAISDPRVKVIRQANAGLGNTLNRLIAMCETEYFARMDADDICDPDRLAAQVAYLQEHREVVMLGTQIRIFSAGAPVSVAAKPLTHAAITERLKAGKFGFCHPTVVFKTETARKAGGYRVQGAGEDLDFFLRMSELGEMANLPDVLFSYRIHGASLATARYRDLQCGYAFALEAARCRAHGVPEPTFEEFAHRWKTRGWRQLILERMDCAAEQSYRSALIAASSGKRWSGGVHLAMAALLRPAAAMGRLRALWSAKTGAAF